MQRSNPAAVITNNCSTFTCRSLAVWRVKLEFIANMLSCARENEFCFQTLVVTRSCPQQVQWQPGLTPVSQPPIGQSDSVLASDWLTASPALVTADQSLCITCKYPGRKYIVQTQPWGACQQGDDRPQQIFKTWTFGVVGFIKISIWFIKNKFSRSFKLCWIYYDLRISII